MPLSSPTTLPTYDDIERAARQIDGTARRTPVVTSRTVDARTHAQVFFKCENFQRAGAFKFRGAYNALSQLDADQRRRGVVAFSSGNHAQAVALAGQLLDIPRVIVMPTDSPAVKRAATLEYGARDRPVRSRARGPRSHRPHARRPTRARRDPSVQSPRHHRWRWNGRARTASGNRTARSDPRPLRRRRTAVRHGARRRGVVARLPRDRRRACRGRRCDPVVSNEVAANGRRTR